ncbi:hypothetical protein J28TS4_04700 [Paenibacillus lautus]|uniref:hypothetical protein n=1 Tax=Paenibacillus lautus TaxID=1401 RepID=UPI001B26CC4D|nr:hypothetical protein [Paenibacillus lautus]GIP02063.1 hypothetical protein J28TS4_04700 [Paenibacillus lautus]
MDPLNKVINRLEGLQQETSTVGNSAASIICETGEFMRELPEIIDQLKQVQIDLDMKKDHGCNHDL